MTRALTGSDSNAPILVLDLGTSSLKAVLFDASGEILAHVAAPIETATPAPGAFEQAPQDWADAARLCIAEIGAAAGPAAVALCGTMENAITLDADGAAVRPALLHSDARGAEMFSLRRERMERMGAAALIGNTPEPLMTAFKWAWLRHAEPEAAARAALLLAGAKDALALRLTGAAVTDPTCGATTGLMDLAARAWDRQLLTLHDIEPSRLPRLAPAVEVIGAVSARAAQEFGLPEGAPVVNGCGDAGAATLGAGAGDEGGVHIYLGATGWLAHVAALDTASLPAPWYVLPHPLRDDMVIQIAPILSAGDSAAWLASIACAGVDDLDAAAQGWDEAPPQALFLPYLKGERSPFQDADARAAFFGLDIGHDAGALYYAVMEGVALAIRHVAEAMGPTPAAARLIGGGAQSAVWPQLIADALGAEICVPDLPAAATAYGAFRIAARALGREAPNRPATAICAPREERRERTARRYGRYLELSALSRRGAWPT